MQLASGSACVIAGLLITGLACPALGQPVTLDGPTRDRILKLAHAAKETHPADPTRAHRAYVIAFNGDFGDVQPASATIVRSQALRIELVTPIRDFHQQIGDRLRTLEPIMGLKASEGVGVLVAPSQMDSPDIMKVLLQRNGALVEPLESHLAPQVMTNAAGMSVALHAGSVLFPTEAFAPGGKVTIILIPSNGANRNIELSDATLRDLK